ncbi:DUF4097 family beta strand repeat-containing protein [Paenibacillus sp. FSL R7-0652]|uniref:DUF4097 family beta strand repeat-containing protein n=1 Tax=Paenibacillus sp. FSL R7-0652 TaxID=2921687 RepID=UPI00315A2E19
MKKVLPLWLCMLVILTSCNQTNALVTDTRKVPLEAVQVISIDNGSTPVTVEAVSGIESVEVSSTAPDRKPVFTIEQSQKDIRIASRNHLFRVFNLANKPVITVKIPLHYEGSLQISSSSGKVKINQPQSDLSINTTSGHIELTADRINSDIHLAAASGNITLRVAEDTPDADWTLESRSGRRSHLLDWAQINEDKHTTQGVTGRGTHQVNVMTRSGNIRIE